MVDLLPYILRYRGPRFFLRPRSFFKNNYPELALQKVSLHRVHTGTARQYRISILNLVRTKKFGAYLSTRTATCTVRAPPRTSTSDKCTSTSYVLASTVWPYDTRVSEVGSRYPMYYSRTAVQYM